MRTKMRNPYHYADKVLSTLRRQVSAEFQNATNRIPFDELNVANAKALSMELYKRLEALNEMAFEQVMKKAYQEAIEEVRGKVDADAPMTILTMLTTAFHPVTGYVYDNEVGRKESRTFESIVAANSRQRFRDAMGRASRLWFGMGRQYVDFMVDAGRLEGFRAAGVKHVMWVSQKDGSTCSCCKERDGNIYSIDEVPEKPHHGCRCYWVAVD